MFKLDDRLAADTVEVTRWPLSRVLLMNDATFPWLVLVPERPGLRDLDDLDAADHQTVMAEITRASRALKETCQPDKINVAALGNVVEQLHIHIIARFRHDPAWPKPVWGMVPAQPYDEDALGETLSRLKDALG